MLPRMQPPTGARRPRRSPGVRGAAHARSPASPASQAAGAAGAASCGTRRHHEGGGLTVRPDVAHEGHSGLSSALPPLLGGAACSASAANMASFLAALAASWARLRSMARSGMAFLPALPPSSSSSSSSSSAPSSSSPRRRTGCRFLLRAASALAACFSATCFLSISCFLASSLAGLPFSSLAARMASCSCFCSTVIEIGTGFVGLPASAFAAKLAAAPAAASRWTASCLSEPASLTRAGSEPSPKISPAAAVAAAVAVAATAAAAELASAAGTSATGVATAAVATGVALATGTVGRGIGIGCCCFGVAAAPRLAPAFAAGGCCTTPVGGCCFGGVRLGRTASSAWARASTATRPRAMSARHMAPWAPTASLLSAPWPAITPLQCDTVR